MEFDLYDELAARAASDSQSIDLVSLTKTVSGLARLGKEVAIPHFKIIYALIIHHTHKKGIPISRTTPCLKGTVCEGGRGIGYTFDHASSRDFDIHLQKIIALYVSSVVTKI